MAHRGRPPLQSNETILEAALASFATNGYDATSVRALNAELGLSHETITQRFGTKSELFRAAVAHGFQRFVAEFDAVVASCGPTTDLEQLRAVVRAFMIATTHHPNLGELLHREAMSDDDRADLLTTIGLVARILDVATLLRRLRDAGLIVETSMRELWFLAQAAAAPLHFRGLASMFDIVDGPLAVEQHIDRMTDHILRGVGAPQAR